MPPEDTNVPVASESPDWGSFIQEQISSVEEGQPTPDPETDTPEPEEPSGNEPDSDNPDVDPIDPEADPAQPEEQPAFSDETEVDLGEGRQPVKLSELKRGYLRQSDYTKKTQALADERKTIDTEKAELQPTREWLDYINSNPWLFSQINSAIQEFQNTGVLPLDEVLQDAQSGRYINHLMAENGKLRKELDSVKGDFDGLKFDSTVGTLISELKAEYGDLITSEYESDLREQIKAKNLDSDTVKRIVKGDLADQNLQKVKKSKKEIEAETLRKQRETKLPPQPQTTGNKPAAPTPDTSAMDWAELARHAAGK